MNPFNRTQPQQQQQPQPQPQPQPQMTGRGSIASLIAEATPPKQGGNYFQPGVYPILYVQTMKFIQTRNGDDAVVVDFDILRSDVPAMPAGTTGNWYQGLSGRARDVGPGAVRDFISKIYSVPVEEVTSELVQFVLGPENPMRGRLIRLEAVRRDGKEFTYHNWRSIPEDMQTKADQLRESVGFPPF